jgi:hypothetical protein
VTRFAWLQARTPVLVVVAALAALAVASAVTGVHLAHLRNSLVTHCQTGCDLATAQFLSHQQFLQRALDPLAQVVPALFGIFWGAPLLAREFETGTYRLAWTQSVTRTRWLVTKLAVLGLSTIVLAGLLTLTITWWYRSLDVLDTNQYAVFDRRNIVPIGYAAFAFVSGVLFGAVIRRTLPAMAATLGVFVFTRIAITQWVRPHLLSPMHTTLSLLDANRLGFEASNGSSVRLVVGGGAPPNGWGLSSKLVNASGHVESAADRAAFVHQYCPAVARLTGGSAQPPDPTAFRACQTQAAHLFHLVVTYQPASRYWTFQWLETGIYLVLALAAALATYWSVTRRTT